MQPEFEHVIGEYGAVVWGAEQMLQALRLLAQGEVAGGDEEGLALRGVLTVSECEGGVAVGV